MKLNNKDYFQRFIFLVLLSLACFQIYRSYKFIKHSPKQNKDIQKLLEVIPQKDYKRVYIDAHNLIKDILEIQLEKQKVFSYPCSFLDKYSFTYTFGVRVYPANQTSQGFIITCKEDKQLFEQYQEQKVPLIRSSEFFYLWKNL